MEAKVVVIPPLELKALIADAVAAAIKYSPLANATLPPDETGGLALAREVTGLSNARIYALVSARAIPHAKRGNRLFFNRTELLTWIKQGSRAVEGQPK